MGRNRNPYTWAGLGLLVAGGLLSLASFLVFAVNWLTALGLAMLILAFILFALSRSIPRLPPEFSRILLEPGIDNLASMVEELGIKGRAIYLPSSLAGGRPRALIPLKSETVSLVGAKALPQRFIVNYGAGAEDVGLLVTTPGTMAVEMLDAIPGPAAAELEAALVSLLVGTLGIADGVRVSGGAEKISVDIVRPRLESRETWAHRSLGGPLAAVVATVTAEAWEKPVRIAREEKKDGRYRVEIEALG